MISVIMMLVFLVTPAGERFVIQFVDVVERAIQGHSGLAELQDIGSAFEGLSTVSCDRARPETPGGNITIDGWAVDRAGNVHGDVSK